MALPLPQFTDNNTAPTAGDVEFRVINASPSSPGGLVDVYIVPPGTDIGGLAPTDFGAELPARQHLPIFGLRH